MPDILLRGVPEPMIKVIKQEAAERDLAPGEFITRVVNFYLILSGPEAPAQVAAARLESKLEPE
jgi:hypothetical protein